nr:AbgT family transporter [Wohlfahrtiimonas chitiniclastica]
MARQCTAPPCGALCHSHYHAFSGIIRAVNLLDADGIRKILSNVVTNFTSFAPLGTVLVAMLGVGIADRAGLFSSAMRLIVLKAPPKLTTAAIVFAGVMSNTAGELGYVVLIPLAAVIFHSLWCYSSALF